MTFTQIITSKTDQLTFGKHKGKSVQEVLRIDPSYVLWLHEDGVCQLPEDIVIEAEEADDSRGVGYSGWDGQLDD